MFIKYKTYVTWSKLSKTARDKLNVLPKSKIIPTVSNKLVKIEPNYNINSLTVYGSNLGSTVGLKLNSSNLDGIYLNSLVP